MEKLKRYTLLTFLITYTFWGIVAIYTQINGITFSSSLLMIVLYIIAVIGPAIAAIIVNKKTSSKTNFIIFLKNCVLPPKKVKWYLSILIIITLYQIIPFYIIGGEKIAPTYNVILTLPVFIFIGGLEEIGWRGVMLPELQHKLSSFYSTLIIGIIWSFWHLPLFFIIGTYQQVYSNFIVFTLTTIAISFILTIIYNKTKSIFMCIFTHALFNSISGTFIVKSSPLEAIIKLIFAIILFVLFQYTTKRKTLSVN